MNYWEKMKLYREYQKQWWTTTYQNFIKYYKIYWDNVIEKILWWYKTRKRNVDLDLLERYYNEDWPTIAAEKLNITPALVHYYIRKIKWQK